MNNENRQNMFDAGVLDALGEKKKRAARAYVVAKWLLRAPGVLLTTGALAATGVEKISNIDVNDNRQVGAFALGAILGGVSHVFSSLRHNAQEQALTYKGMSNDLIEQSPNGSVQDFRTGQESLEFFDGTIKLKNGGTDVVIASQRRADLNELYEKNNTAAGNFVLDMQTNTYPSRLEVPTSRIVM